MKKIKILLFLLPLLSAGCISSNQQNAESFLSWCAAHDIQAGKIEQETDTMAYSHTETITGLYKVGNDFKIADLSAQLSVPRIFGGGATTYFKATGVEISKSGVASLPPPPPIK